MGAIAFVAAAVATTITALVTGPDAVDWAVLTTSLALLLLARHPAR
jgi:hypothetical protein